MSNFVIQVSQLGKKYSGGHFNRPLRETINDMVMSPVRVVRRTAKPVPQKREFWALRDVSFEVQRGQVLGIIGSNGSGKSTLLRIISRIARPTEGYVRVRGRVGSLLEVGTGFHPELTGRENVYLSGSILGMKWAAIHAQFDQIVAFSGIADHLDMPVKYYSSGMYVRLAFSVAAHLDADILLLDEVLAVGDLDFQTKSRAKMNELVRSGRTILLVSHTLEAISEICNTVLWLEHGCQAAFGTPSEVIALYSEKILGPKAEAEGSLT